jgi:cytosine/creatinine deaminase
VTATAAPACRRMDFSVACAYAHGTKALRTHLINMTPRQRSLTWPAFSRLREKWAGKVGVQSSSSTMPALCATLGRTAVQRRQAPDMQCS